MTAALVDASALVALLDESDNQHERWIQALKTIRDSLVTVWPALTEAMHLLSGDARGPEALCDMVHDGVLDVLDLHPADMPRVQTLMQKYRDLPMDFADAAIVCVAERERLVRVVTFDRHFGIYRLPGRRRFTVVPPRRSGR